ncbi:LysM peptidoglycan-binding domain-containing protein [Hyphomicrobium sp.]|uniref:LysM peptidoglycan-binding domain-containing protein n=1 Tax=Hyphomicrobium sp. TaxID=82 RepID=UPI0025C5FB61|nr:LysM peptidoglycan-binding domain-containing protein [Hyphomicrobium sp.]MCC7253378.1 LysM peptidoglycan-binding domain-containing protein [Hyphomicrobium sp.]
MRSRHRPLGATALMLAGLSALIAGCSSGGSQDTLTTSSLRPNEGMRRDAPRRYPDGSTSGGGYYGRPTAEAPRRYVDPGQPTPREMAAYDSGHGNYGVPRSIETASIGNTAHAYDPGARWQQPPSGITTGSTGPTPTGYYGKPRQQAPHNSQIVEVREGDTLYSLSRRHGVPVGDLVAVNQLPNDRIAIGQRLIIPTRYR